MLIYWQKLQEKEENKKVATLSNSYHPTSNCGDNGD